VSNRIKTECTVRKVSVSLHSEAGLDMDRIHPWIGLDWWDNYDPVFN